MHSFFRRSSQAQLQSFGHVFAALAIVALAIVAATPEAHATAGVCDTAGPIEVESSLPSGPTAYATLGAAFTDINGGVHQGTIAIDVCGNTVEERFGHVDVSVSRGPLATSMT